MAWIEGNQKRRKHFKNINEEILTKEGFLEEHEAKILLYKFLKENPSFTCELLTGVKLFPFQHMAIKSMMLTDYFLGCWSRGLSKSYSTAIFAILDAVLHQGVHLGIISKSFRQCAHPESLVLTENGLKQLQYLQLGEKVLSERGLNKVLHKWSNEPCAGIKLETQRGYSIRGKKEHSVLVLNTATQEKEYKDLKDLQQGDYIAIQLTPDIFSAKCPRGFSTDESYFYGLIIGDGWVSKDKYKACILTTSDQETIDFFNDFARNKNLNPLASVKGDSQAKSIRINSRDFVQDFFKEYDDSKKAYEKVLPEILLQTTKENTSAWLAGLFDSDGCVGQDRVELSCSSIHLVKQVQLTLLRFGIVSKIQKEKARGDMVIMGVPCVGRESFKLRITGLPFIKKFQDQIGFRLSRKREALNNICSCDKNAGADLIYGSGKYLCSKYSFPETLRKNLSRASLNRIINTYTDRIGPEDINKLRQLADSLIYWDKVVGLDEIENLETIDIEVENEHCYTAEGFINHNSRMIFNKIEDIMKTPKASMFAEAVTRVSKTNDQWVMEIGRSKITALPLGDGEKLRGFRFQRMIIDEFLLMPERIFNEVILPFLSVVENPTERQEIYNLESQLITSGEMAEDERTQWPNNKIIALSSASYKFEYLYKLYQQYEHLILNPEKSDVAHRVIMHLSYDCAPTQLYDQSLIQQAKSTLSQSQFDREFGSIFTDDSSGYFKVSKMAACTIEDGQGQCVEVAGEPNDEYIVSFDPSWSESESSDDFGMHVIKINKEKRIGTVVHSYAISGTRLKDHIFYFYYLLTSFNVVCIVGDYNGGVQFLNACNESELFKSNNLKIDCFDADFDDVQNYNTSLKEARNQYNVTSKKICHLRRPTSQWIRFANELLQSSFDHKKIWFAGSAINDDYQRQRGKSIPIDQIKFLRVADADEKNAAAKMIDFIEHQKDMIDLTKAECALIQVTTTAQGTQSFDLPQNLKRQNGADKARRDSYSALVLGNWMVQTYFDMMNFQADEVESTFTPFFA